MKNEKPGKIVNELVWKRRDTRNIYEGSFQSTLQCLYFY